MNEEKINLSPKVFISYSHGTEQHEDRVLKLARELVENGIDVKIDKWDIRPGQNLHKFMEEMVNNNDINKVLVVCDKLYADKANDRKGGVGIETDIITPEVYGNSQNTKFIPVVFEKDKNRDAYLPAYFKSRYYIDLCLDNDKYSEAFEDLIRLIIGKPEHTKPKLGKIPNYILEEDKRGQTSASARAVRAAFENGKNIVPKLKSYCIDAFVPNLDNFIIQNKSNTSIEDEKKNFLKTLNDFTTYRDEYLEIMEKAAKYNFQELESIIYSFFEKLLSYKKDKSKEYGTENIEFIIYELFLYTVGILIKEERFDTVAELLKRESVELDNCEKQKKMFEKTYFNSNGRVFEALKQGEDGGRYINYAVTYMMNKRNNNILSKLELIDADVLIYLKALIEREIHKQLSLWWYPLTKIRLGWGDKSPLFIRCASIGYTKKVDVIFKYSMLKDFKEISEKKLLVFPHEDPWRKNIISDYINISSLGTRE
jgi:hypothetical protein